MNSLIYIIPITVVIIIVVIGVVVGTKKAAQYNATLAQTDTAKVVVEKVEHKDRIYEAIGVNQISDHPLGAVQGVIRAHFLRHILTGVLLIAIAIAGLYILYFTDMEFFVPREPFYMLICTVLMMCVIGFGFQQFYFITCRVKLRRRGFEVCSIFGVKGYEYMDADFHLFETVERKRQSNHSAGATNGFNFIWVCQIIIKSKHKLIELKSSRYAALHRKMGDLTKMIVWVD